MRECQDEVKKRSRPANRKQKLSPAVEALLGLAPTVPPVRDLQRELIKTDERVDEGVRRRGDGQII